MKEKEIIEILDEFETAQQERLEGSETKLIKTEFYEEFDINDIDFRKIFITTEEDPMGNVARNIYCRGKSGWIEILSVDSEGNVYIENPELAKSLGIVNIQKTIEANEGRLRGISEKADSKEISEQLNKDEDKASPSIVINNPTNNEKLEITSYKKIKDHNFEEQLGQDLSKYKEVGFAYSETENAFVLVGKVNGKFERVDGVEKAIPTLKTIISIDENGEKVEKKVPHALMETSNDNKELAVTIGTYGYTDIETIERTSSDQRVAKPVHEQGETQSGGEQDYQTRYAAKSEGQYASYHVAEKAKDTPIGEESKGDVSEAMDGTNNDNLLTPEQQEKIKETANKLKISEDAMLEAFNDADGKDFEGKLANAEEEIEEQYPSPKRRR